MKSEYTKFALAAVLLLAAACTAPASDPMQRLEHARSLDEARPVAAFELTDQHGREFTQARLRGKWNVLFAGFTHCPDICPTTLTLLATAQKRAGIGSEDLRMVFVSVDPERDKPAHLAEYLGHFDSEWTGLSGAKEELDHLMDSLQMAYVRVPMGNGEYTMDHSTALALIDPEGRMRGYFKAPLNAAELAEDLGRIARAGR